MPDHFRFSYQGSTRGSTGRARASDRWSAADDASTAAPVNPLLATAVFAITFFLPITLPMGMAEAWVQWRSESGEPLKWDRREIEMEARLGGNEGATCLPRAEGVELYEFGPCWEDVVRSAADQYYRTDARLRIDITSSPAERTCIIGDGTNTITVGDTYCGYAFGDRSVAIAFNRYTIKNGIILESDVVFNTAVTWNSYSGPRRRLSNDTMLFDMHRVAIHEFGHTWGLYHPDESGQTVAAIMNSAVSDIDRLQPDDIEGILAIYGSKGISAGAADPPRVVLQAIAPITAEDRSTIRIRCEDEQSDCPVFLDCTDQGSGRAFSGALSDQIPAGGSFALSSADIVRITGGTPWDKRLTCKLRSPRDVSGQVWTRSGNGVLINNTAVAEPSYSEERYTVRLYSIPAPGGVDESNIRVHCPIDAHSDCDDIAIRCWEDDGTLHEGSLETVERGSVEHFQSQRLADLIDHRWQGMGLSCKLVSSFGITAQILTRTGGNALVNNSEVGRLPMQR
ncbi:matrixin family metalloprotease [Thioalkalivibrio sp. HK1]|uniref:matrixin family metalloprotease n=1 Tax=Thioalkalivibrio sp. HK1 TaxID=1469245 RepID=UPI00046FE8D3|nr:matrixin family metalloprotease [Thioalkalivibrio sp. HK1]